MAVQTVDTVVFADPGNPVELQSWLTGHPLAIITTIVVMNNVFYIVHT